MKRIHVILTGLSFTILLLSINRLTSLTSNYLQPYDFLRWLDFNAMISIPLLSVILYFLLFREIVKESNFQKTKLFGVLSIILISGVYLFGASSGDHEVTNYLNTRFCDSGKLESQICNIIRYNDDEFSHIVYYIGFILLNVSLIFTEINSPQKNAMTKKDKIIVSGNALFIALGIFANLAFEETGLDLIFFGSLMILSLYMLFTRKNLVFRLPVIFYFAVSYTVGVVSTILYKLAF